MVSALSLHSIEMMRRRPQDIFDLHIGTTGEIARTAFVETFLENTDCGALLFMDADHTVPRDAAERLRSHDLPMVSAHYVRRSWPPYPVAYAPDESWPLRPYIDHPTTGLVEIGATGFGCLYVTREVVKAIQDTLEAEEPIVANYPYPERAGDWGRVGGDLRFCDKARQLGYKIYMDMNLSIGHVAWAPLGMKEFILAGRDRPFLDNYRQEAAKKLGGNQMDQATKEAIEARMVWHEREVTEAERKILVLRREILGLREEIVRREGAGKEDLELLKESRDTEIEPEVPLSSTEVPLRDITTGEDGNIEIIE